MEWGLLFLQRDLVQMVYVVHDGYLSNATAEDAEDVLAHAKAAASLKAHVSDEVRMEDDNALQNCIEFLIRFLFLSSFFCIRTGQR